MAAAAAALLFLALPFLAHGNVYMSAPTARSGTAAANSGGPATVSNGTAWPAVETTVTMGRHGVCGGVAGSGAFETASSNVKVMYADHQFNVTVTMAVSYGGFIEFRLCDPAAADDDLAAACVAATPLERVQQAGEANIDPVYPGRWFVPPGAFGQQRIRVVVPPGAECAGCVLQMYYLTAHRCVPPGFRSHTFPDASWYDAGLPDCAGAQGSSYPVEFWNCADVEVRAPECQPDTDGDGLDACEDVCPNDNPNDINEDGICDSEEKMLVAYFASWARFREQPYRMGPQDIDSRLVSHINWAFAILDNEYRVKPFEPSDVSDGVLEVFQAHVRALNPFVETMITIGGATFNHQDATKHIFTNMVAAAGSRAVFITSAIAFARDHGFSGIDLDWEFPGLASNGGRPEDKANFVLLLQELRAAINLDAVSRSLNPLLLSVAVSAGPAVISGAYDLSALHGYVDWFNVMNYDYNGPWSSVTDSHTPMASYAGLDIPTTINIFLNAGVPRTKIVMGLASYGRGWTLQDPNSHGLGAPATGPSNAGKYTSEPGLLAYYELMNLAASGTVVFDSFSQSNYLYSGNQWVSFDDNHTITLKAKYIEDMDLAGAMLWTLDMDLYSGGVGYGHPVTESVRAALPIPTGNGSARKSDDHSLHMTITIVSVSVGVGFLLAMICGMLNRKGDWDSLDSAANRMDGKKNFNLNRALQMEHAELQRDWYEEELRRSVEQERARKPFAPPFDDEQV